MDGLYTNPSRSEPYSRIAVLMTRRLARVLVSSLLTVAPLLTLGCKSQKESAASDTSKAATEPPAAPSTPPARPAGEPPTNPHVSPGGPAALPPAAITWKAPAGWEEMPRRSPMRQATYKVPGDAGPAETAVYYFGPGQGGDVESNIERWVGQFQDRAHDAVERDTREVNGLKVYTVAVAKGTYSSGMPGGPTGPQKDWGLAGAIVEAPSGRYFFKMTGPAKTVDQQRRAFDNLLDSVAVKG